MKIKKQYLNEKTLYPYGFRRTVKTYGDEWWKSNEYSSIFIEPSGEIAVFIMRPYTTVLIDDAIYQLIVDGLIEIEKEKTW